MTNDTAIWPGRGRIGRLSSLHSHGHMTPLYTVHEANQSHHSLRTGTASSILSFRHVSFFVFRASSSSCRSSQPRPTNSRVPTRGVCSLLLLLSSASKIRLVADHIVHPSTSSTMTRLSTSFISIGRFVWLKWKISKGASRRRRRRRRDGSKNGGGTSSPKFAEDGDTSYSSSHPI
jgi:hypothetical protein